MSETLKQNITYRFGQVTESISRLIPIGASSFEDFSTKVGLHECSIIEARVKIYNECEADGGGDPRLSYVYILGTGYDIDYRAISSKRREIKYIRNYGYIPNGEIRTKQQYDGILLMGLATANNSLRVFQRDFLDIETRLSQTIKGNSTVISDESRSILDGVEVPETSFFRNTEGSSRFVLKPESVPNIHLLLSIYGNPSGNLPEFSIDTPVSFTKMFTDMKRSIRNIIKRQNNNSEGSNF